MKRLIGAALCGVLALGFVSSAVAQDDAKSKLEVQYEEKVSKPWFVDNGFTADYDKARAAAKESGKPIFAYFTRSYAP